MINWEWKFADDYENLGQWYDAKNYMYSEWLKDRYNIKKFLRLSFLCWVISIDVGYLVDENKINQDEFQELLKKLFDFGVQYFKDNINFQWLYGYMVSLTPVLFGNEFIMQEIGKDWSYKAYLKDPQDPVIKSIFLEGIDFENRKKLGYKQVCREIIPILESRFRGNGYMQKYFKSLFIVEVMSNN